MRKFLIVALGTIGLCLGLVQPAQAVTGGQYMTTTVNSCSTGFVLQSSAASYMVTAGHCLKISGSRSWSVVSTGEALGNTVARAEYGTSGDRGALRLARRQGTTVNGTAMTSIGNQGPGETVCARFGRSNRSDCGTVVAGGRDFCVNMSTQGLPDTRVCGLVQASGFANPRPIPGDSGSPVTNGSTEAVGIYVGTTGTSSILYAPLTYIAADWGLSLGQVGGFARTDAQGMSAIQPPTHILNDVNSAVAIAACETTQCWGWQRLERGQNTNQVAGWVYHGGAVSYAANAKLRFWYKTSTTGWTWSRCVNVSSSVPIVKLSTAYSWKVHVTPNSLC